MFSFNINLKDTLQSSNSNGIINLLYTIDNYNITLIFSNFNSINNKDLLCSAKIIISNNETHDIISANIESTNYNNIKDNNFFYSLTINQTVNVFNNKLINKKIVWKSNHSILHASVMSIEDIYPWTGGIINGFFLWQGNFVNNQQENIYYYDGVSSPQIDSNSSSNLINGSGVYQYNDIIPENMNSIFLFTGYSNIKDVLNNLVNYTTGNNMLDNAQSYLKNLTDNKQPYLLSLVLGGGLQSTGSWDTGISGALYSCYEACTKEGTAFNYIESETGNTLTGTGTGILNYTYNSLCFDIETWGGNSTTGSSGTDFLNFFNYIKNNQNSTFYTFEMIIIVSMSHSCSNFNGTGQKVLSTIYADKNKYYDYICPQMYTQNIGTTNEYAANYNILWTDNYDGANNSFQYYLSQNANYEYYKNKMILPAVNFQNLYNSSGTNISKYPNLYFYQSSDNNINPAANLPTGYIKINYNIDSGVKSFFNAIMNSTDDNDIGGNLQWVNGNLQV